MTTSDAILLLALIWFVLFIISAATMAIFVVPAMRMAAHTLRHEAETSAAPAGRAAAVATAALPAVPSAHGNAAEKEAHALPLGA